MRWPFTAYDQTGNAVEVKIVESKHGWLDNQDKNDWDVWKTYIKDKEITIWEATLNIVTSQNGDKILYDIFQ